MQRVSTNLTLFFKFFVPIFWIVFFGATTLALFFYQGELLGESQGEALRWGALFAYLTGLALFYFTLLQLKRVEMDEAFVYVTNYFKSVRYPWHNIAAITESRLPFFMVVTVQLNTPGIFGKTIRFVASNRLYRDFKTQFPQLLEAVAPKQG